MLVKEKKNTNFNLPTPLSEHLDAMAQEGNVNGKELWVAISAAIVSLSRCSHRERRLLFGLMRETDRHSEWDQIIPPQIRPRRAAKDPDEPEKPEEE